MRDPSVEQNFRGKKAVVTGGANGIGLAVARSFVLAGASVWIFDLAEARPFEAAGSIGAAAMVVDVADRQSVRDAFARVTDVSVVIVNAGIGPSGSLLETTPEVWNRVLSINLSGAFYTVQAAPSRCGVAAQARSCSLPPPIPTTASQT